MNATTLFSDGFESGNFTMWTTTYTTAGETATVDTASPHSGSYSAKFATNGNSTGEQSVVQKTLSPSQSNIYSTGYFKVASYLPNANGKYITLLTYRTTTIPSTEINSLQLFNNSGTISLKLSYYNGATPLSSLAAFNWQLNTYYCLEMHTKIDATAGEVEVWVDGVSKIHITGIDTDDYGNVLIVRMGIEWEYMQVSNTVYLDDVEIADEYIPPLEQQGPSVLVSGKNSTVASSSCKFYVHWSTSVGNLDHYVFGTNNTGTWVNETATAFPAGQTQAWSNVTKVLNNQIGKLIRWQVWANNTAGFWDSTTLLNFSITTGAGLKFSTSWEELTSVPKGSFNVNNTVDGALIPVHFNWGPESDKTYNYGWVEPTQENHGITAHSGSKSIGMKTASTMRVELIMSYTTLTNLGLGQQFYISMWIYFPSNWTVYPTGSNWYSMFNVVDTSTGVGYPYTSFHILERAPYGTGLVDLTLAYRGENFNDYWDPVDGCIVNNYQLPRGEWIHFEWFEELSSNYGRVIAWFNGEKLWDWYAVDHPVLADTGHTWGLQFGKVYHNPSSYLMQYWLDDMQLWNDIPSETGDLSPPTYSGVAHSTTITGQPALFNSLWQDDVALSGNIFSWNGTGVWTNNTWVTLSGNPAWATATKTLPASSIKVGYRWFANDTSDNWASTSIYTFITTPLSISITVLLNEPSDGGTVHSKYGGFSYYAIFFSAIVNASLWTNESGTWQLEAWDMSPFNASEGISILFYDWVASGTFIWNIAVYNTTDKVFAQANRTLTVQLDPYSQGTFYPFIVPAANTATFSSDWMDGNGLSGYIFSCNVTGSWANDTWITLDHAMVAHIIVNKPTPSTPNLYIGFRFFVNDTDDKWVGTLVYASEISFFNTQALINYNDNLFMSGLPYLQSATHIVSALSLADKVLTYTINASTGLTSTTTLNVTFYGEPADVTGATTFSYNEATLILTLTKLHSSPAVITITWGAIPTPIIAPDFSSWWQWLAEGDMLGFLQAIYIMAFGSADIFYALVALLVMGAIYIRTHSLILIGILWLLVGVVLIAALPLVAGLGVFFMILGVASLLFQLFKPSSPSY